MKRNRIKEIGGPFYQLFMLVLSVYVICVLVLELFILKNDEIAKVLSSIDFVICFFFMFDFFVNLFSAKDKKQYLKWGWIDFIASIPMLDSLRWGRISRIIRIIRFIRSIRSIRRIYKEALDTKVESLSFIVLLITFLVYTVCASLILYVEQGSNSEVDTAKEALWWAFLNIMNAKVSIGIVTTGAGQFMTILLNKVGLLLFAYLNGMIIAWLIQKKQPSNVENQN